jgi:RNA polymerase sigma-70 factor (ECF subfamily)
VIPRDLAPVLHDLLRRHFRRVAGIEVIVERRGGERRVAADRRTAATPEPVPGDGESERRQVRGQSGRRVSERRAPVLVVDSRALPRRARAYADRLVFVERLEPSELSAEDQDTLRLVTSFQAGDREVFGALYARYFDRVYMYLRVLCRDVHGAEDLAQRVFLAAFEALPRYEVRSVPFRAWLFSIARRRALSWLKDRHRVDVRDPGEFADIGGPGEASAPDVLSWLSDHEVLLFVERLPLAQRQVLLLRYTLDLDHTTTAKVLGTTPDNVRVLHRRALTFLRSRLAALGRAPAGSGHAPQRIRGCLGQAPVTRARRFALRP